MEPGISAPLVVNGESRGLVGQRQPCPAAAHSGARSSEGSDALFRRGAQCGRGSGSDGRSTTRRRALLWGAAAGGVVVVVTLIGVLASGLTRAGAGRGPAPPAALANGGTPAGSGGSSSGAVIDGNYCLSLPESVQQYCIKYYSAPGKKRFQAAQEWQRMDATTFNCAGIEPECINADLEADSQGATACRPLQDGAACWPGSVCHRGLCGGADELGIKMESAAVAALTKGGSDADAPPKKDDKKPDPKKQDAVKKDDKKPPQPQPAVKKPPSPPPPSPPPPPPPPPQATYMSGGRLVVYDIPLPSPPAPAQPVAGWATVASVVESKAKLTRVPQTFLATSHEWDRMMDYANNVAAFKNIFREFGPSPIIRVGGATQDRMVGQPATEIWVALRKMHEAFNARFLIGLPLLPSDSIERATTMMKTVEKYIPKKALLGYELGNEPEFWPDSVGGFKAKDPKKFVPGFDAYAEYFDRVATAINGCPKNGSAPNPMLSGPGWGNVNTIDAKWLSKHARMKGAKCYMRELSVHYYPYINNVTVDSKGLLAQDLQDFGLEKFKWLVGVANDVKLKLRISETNSLYGGGRSGLSDTAAGMLWCADALFAFSKAGAVGFHFHWGFGGRPIHGGQPNTGVQTNFYDDDPARPYPSVHAPWYAYLLFRTATADRSGGFSDTVHVKTATKMNGCKANLKVWSLVADSGDLRVAVLNKDAKIGCNVEITVDPEYCGPVGNLSRLMPGWGGMDSKVGILWRNMSYESTNNGLPTGIPVDYPINSVPLKGNSGKCKFTFAMTIASGAVLQVRSKNPPRMLSGAPQPAVKAKPSPPVTPAPLPSTLPLPLPAAAAPAANLARAAAAGVLPAVPVVAAAAPAAAVNAAVPARPSP